MIACLDLEGVLVPEIWINVAERTGISELRRTTRDEPDYDKLMRARIAILDRHGLTLRDIQAAIDAMGPLPGANEFLAWLRQRAQVIILSDTFYQFAAPLMRQLGHPCLFCHTLEVDGKHRVAGYRLRLNDSKRRAVEALESAFALLWNDCSASPGITVRLAPESVFALVRNTQSTLAGNVQPLFTGDGAGGRPGTPGRGAEVTPHGSHASAPRSGACSALPSRAGERNGCREACFGQRALRKIAACRLPARATPARQKGWNVV